MTKFEQNVFINCPFEKSYNMGLLRPMLFIIIYLGLEPRIALRTLDSGHSRLEKIKKLIEDSKYSIHDLSMNKSKKVGEIARLNMPFELGLDIACRWNKIKKYKQKRCLILEEKRYSLTKALSDLAGMDVRPHKGNSKTLIYEIRDWFIGLGQIAPSPSVIEDEYIYFLGDLKAVLKKDKFRESQLSTNDFIKYIKRWIFDKKQKEKNKRITT